jgi:hypothetical protein
MGRKHQRPQRGPHRPEPAGHDGGADPAQRHVEGRLIARRLALLPPPRVYKLFGELRGAKVNNRRTRAIMRDWLAARPDLAFDAVKYRPRSATPT